MIIEKLAFIIVFVTSNSSSDNKGSLIMQQ